MVNESGGGGTIIRDSSVRPVDCNIGRERFLYGWFFKVALLCWIFGKRYLFCSFNSSLKNAKFHLTKFTSNSQAGIDQLPSIEIANNILVSKILKIFGLLWNIQTDIINPAGIYQLQFNNRNTRTRCQMYSKLTIKTPERRYWRVFTVNFEHILHLVLVFLLLTLNM